MTLKVGSLHTLKNEPMKDYPHAVDDPLAKYENAEALAGGIPTAKLLSIPSDGHLFLSQEETVRMEIARFIKSLK